MSDCAHSKFPLPNLQKTFTAGTSLPSRVIYRILELILCGFGCAENRTEVHIGFVQQSGGAHGRLRTPEIHSAS
jgi:hypothetical protein